MKNDRQNNLLKTYPDTKKKNHYFNTNVVVSLLVFLIMITPVFGQDQPTIKTNKLSKEAAHNYSKLTYKIIDADSSTFGYDIYLDGKLKIHQTSIPALPGNKGFKTKTQAEKVAKLVIRKMMAGEMPPTVHMEELKKLKVL